MPRRFQLRHIAATILVLGAIVTVWRTAHALSANATADKANNPRLVGGNVQPPETCGKSGCHDMPPAQCQGSVEILGLPGCYVAGQTYNLQVRVTQAGAMRWGFEVGAQYSEGNQWDYEGAGTLDNAAGARTKKVTSADGKRSFITHDKNSANGNGTYPGTGSPVTYDFKWTAPGNADRQTRVCFYVAGLAADNNHDSDGDCTYNTTVCVNPCGPTDTRQSSWGQVKTIYKK